LTQRPRGLATSNIFDQNTLSTPHSQDKTHW